MLMNNTLKLLQEDDEKAILGGYGIAFHGEDLTGENFKPDTYYGRSMGKGQDVYIDHTLDTVVKTKDGKKYKLKGINDSVGEIIEVTPDDEGLYMQLMIEKASQYWEMVQTMLDTKRLGLSTATAQHLKKPPGHGGTIKSWPITEVSLTLTPAEPRTVGVEQLKSDQTEQGNQPEALISEADDIPAVDAQSEPEPVQIVIEVEEQKEEINIMADEKETQPEAVNVEEFKALSDNVNRILEVLNNTPKAKGTLIAPDSEKDHPEVKSFGDFLLAVKNRNVKRLHSVYGAVKDLSEGVGTEGGYTVPVEQRTELLRVDATTSPVLSRVRTVPVGTDSGTYPALDQYITPTAGAGNTALAAGVSATTTAEGATLTETQATFEQLQYRIVKLGGYTEVSNELLADSPLAIEQLLSDLFRIAINSKRERNVIRGSGAGEYQGILNAACAIGITPASDNTFGEADALSMLSRFKPVSGQGVWIMHRGIIPDFSGFTASDADLVSWNSALRGSLLGYPIVYSEHSPQDDAAGAVILADLGAYLEFTRQDVQIAYSEHAAFTSDKGTWRFTFRADGMPWLKSAITLADPTGSYTVSPFVYHND